MRLPFFFLLALPLASCNDFQNKHSDDPRPSSLPADGQQLGTGTQLVASHWEFNAGLSSADAAGALVFTPALTVPQRGWEHYDFDGRGRFTHTAPGATDKPVTTTGTYQQSGSTVVLQWRRGQATLRILSLTSKQLRLTRTY